MNAADYARLVSLAAIWGASFIFMRVTAPAFRTVLTAVGCLLIAGWCSRPGSPAWRALTLSGICLTPNGGYCWYRHLAPRLGLDTRHLWTERFLSTREVETLIGGAELALQRLDHWRFIDQGDLPVSWGSVLRADGSEGICGSEFYGIAFSAVRTKKIGNSTHKREQVRSWLT